MTLTDIQKQIVRTEGNLVVSASAGTGKTFAMVQKIVKEITENRTHKVIAAITFTVKAANEIKERLSLDTFLHFIGTNNSFAIEEIIKPFMKDVYGSDFDIDMSTDYSVKVNTYQEAIDKIKNDGVLCKYSDPKQNFIFDLAQFILENSLACRLYLKSKYFKIYIDEYQDCDISMHKFFMYLCGELQIETFIVGDDKQSIYIWRGAYPEAFKSVMSNPNFICLHMRENHRSCQQIQNYSNLLFEETCEQYIPTEDLSNIVCICHTEANWAKKVVGEIDPNKTSALLRFKHNDVNLGASELTSNGLEYVYIPQPPISDITTNSSWLYLSIAKYIILERYSVYDVISDIPVEGNESRKTVSCVKRSLEKIEDSKHDLPKFHEYVTTLAEYLGYKTRTEHIQKLHDTISDPCFYPAFDKESYQHIAITFHSSKGLEFDQVIIFAEDYSLGDITSLYNHYVAVTRAKTKLIIVYKDSMKAKQYANNLKKILSESNLTARDVMTVK